jgi:hypothetical protein
MPENKNDNPDERYARNLPSLLIPYWGPGERGPSDPGDRGDGRPLPSDIIPYLCEGIKTAAPYKPGTPLTVTVDVRNWGGGVVGSNAVVKVWWEYPAPTYAMMNPNQLLGVKPVDVAPRGSTKTSLAMTYTFPSFTFPSLPPPHICLIACVEHPQDQSPRRTDLEKSLIPLPGLERHWAQKNLTYIAPNSGGTINFPFMANNPLLRESVFIFEVRPFVGEKLARLIRTVRAEPIETEARFEICGIRDLHDMWSERQSTHPCPVLLAAGSRTSMHLRIQLSKVPTEGQFAGFELLQRSREDDHLVGGIALIVLAPDLERR